MKGSEKLSSITSVIIYNSPCCILPDYVPQITDPNPFIQDLVIWTGKGDQTYSGKCGEFGKRR